MTNDGVTKSELWIVSSVAFSSRSASAGSSKSSSKEKKWTLLSSGGRRFICSPARRQRAISQESEWICGRFQAAVQLLVGLFQWGSTHGHPSRGSTQPPHSCSTASAPPTPTPQRGPQPSTIQRRSETCVHVRGSGQPTLMLIKCVYLCLFTD